MFVSNRFRITLGHISAGPASTVDFRVEALDGSYRETFRGFEVDLETASRCLGLGDGVVIVHVSRDAWQHETLDWPESVINAALRSQEPL